jgi:hypothetical protein
MIKITEKKIDDNKNILMVKNTSSKSSKTIRKNKIIVLKKYFILANNRRPLVRNMKQYGALSQIERILNVSKQ